MKSSHGNVWLCALMAVVGALLLTMRGPAPVAEAGRDRFDQPDAAADFEYARRRPLTAGIDTRASYAQAEARAERMPRFSSRIDRVLPVTQPRANVWFTSATQGVLDAWEPLGPGNIGGRTRVVRFHPRRPDTIFAAGVSGGIWRLDEVGGTWRPISQSMMNIAVNSLVIDPREPDVMYAGTGEGFIREEIRGTGLPLRGAGIFATRDGGNTWRRLEQTEGPDFYWVNDLELGIGDSRRIYAATRTGVWRSADAGASWDRIIETSVRGGCLDLALRPDVQDDVLFAACGTYEQATVYRIRSAAREAIGEVVLREPHQGRTSLAISPSRPDVVYAMAASNDPGPDGNYEQGLLAVFRSERGGDPGSWETRVTNTDRDRINTLLLTNIYGAMVRECSTNPNAQNNYTNMGWYVNVLAVDPREPDRVWAGGVDWFRSDDGGRTWGMATISANGPSFAHVDQHGIAFHPAYDGQGNQIVLIGNDGGVFRSENARGGTATGARAACEANRVGVNWQSLNRGYGVTQFYHGVTWADGTSFLGGTQDNGTILGRESDGPEGWRTIFGGDGSYSAVANNGQTIFAQSQFSNIGRSTNGGRQFQNVRNGLDPIRSSVLNAATNFLFITPLAMDPTDPQRLWIGGEFLYRTTDNAALWTKASTAMPDGGVVSALAVSFNDSNVVAAGTTKGDVLVATTALSTTSSTEWPVSRPREGWVTSVAFDARNPTVMYATYGNFGGSHVFRSGNGGRTWTALDGSGDATLPDIPVHCIVVDQDDPARLYLATDIGVFVSTNTGSQWLIEETGFGPAVTEWLAYLRDSKGRRLLFAFTHGRGAWRVALP
jgi:photosystem II stability/assembly factor-like uncharacterized protein